MIVLFFCHHGYLLLILPIIKGDLSNGVERKESDEK